jgi:hypothetical protein
MKKLKNLSVIILLISSITSCSKKEIVKETSEVKNVYLIGEEFAYGYSSDQNPIKAILWKNGESSVLPNAVSAISGCVSGNDIYTISTDGKCWKNGVQKLLPAAQDGSSIYSTNSIFVNNEDIYMTGKSVNGSSQIIKPTFWKNGQPTSFDLPSSNINIISTILVNNDFYVLGSETITEQNPAGGFISYQEFKYWKNGVVKNITETPLTGNNRISSAKIYVSQSNDVYILSTDYSSNYKCFKNGISVGNFINARSFNAIDVVNNDIYIVGTKYNFTENKTLPTYWKNGEFTYITNGVLDATVNSIKVIGNDVYIGGYGRNSEGIITAKYWKNGVSNQVKDLTTKTKSNDILITN